MMQSWMADHDLFVELLSALSRHVGTVLCRFNMFQHSVLSAECSLHRVGSLQAFSERNTCEVA